jgi:hypothetical protein
MTASEPWITNVLDKSVDDHASASDGNLSTDSPVIMPSV